MTLTGNILITGGAGTLGNAIVRTAQAEHWDCTFTIYSRSEYLQAQMRQRYPLCRYVLGDVADYDRLSAAIAGHDLVIHAAAMKRIPECEAQPAACFTTNVQGSANVARACIAHGVKRCIGISTDKACRAVTVYGASKLMMEGIFRSPLREHRGTTFMLVRYGNVVASRGSVIPIWRQQAKEGKPLTITDKRCTRFWMSESNAVHLIDFASRSGPHVVVIPQMGALSLVEMAEMIAPGCATVETGLRSCEKIHEDLVHPDERASDWSDPKDPLCGTFMLHDTIAEPSFRRGYSYTSDTAPRLTKAQFLAMLAEAEAHE